MQKLTAILTFVVLVSCQVPQLPQQFTAKVVADLPFIGQIPSILYYDYPNLRQRIDMTQWGQTAITIYRYDLGYQFQIMAGSCQSQELTDELFPMTVPPFAVYNGTEYIGNQEAELWTADIFGVVDMNYYVTNSTDADGKVQYSLLRFLADMPGGMTVSYTFNSVTPGIPAAALFDYTQYGCAVPQPPITYSVSGYVKNAINNQVISGAAVRLSNGASTTSNSDGVYTFSNVNAGVYTASIPASSNFFGANTTLNVTADIPAGTVADFNLSPTLPAGQWRIVLTWGSLPSDLDSWFYSTSGCTIYYGKRSCSAGSGSGTLDVDARNGYGPETITLNNFSGTYKVNIYSNNGYFPSSNARVQIYNSKGLVNDIRVPTAGYTSTARTWTVFSLDANLVTVINTFQ